MNESENSYLGLLVLIFTTVVIVVIFLVLLTTDTDFRSLTKIIF